METPQEKLKQTNQGNSNENNSIQISKFTKCINDYKKKYKLTLFFDVLNLILSISCIITYIYSTYDPNIFAYNQTFFWYNFLARVYFLIDFIWSIITVKGDKKFEFFGYVLQEITTIIPFLFVRLINGLNEIYTNSSYLITNSLVCLRFIRVQYLSKYIQSEVNKKLYTISVSILSLLLFATSIVNTVENFESIGPYNLYLPKDCEPQLCTEYNESFHSTFFYVLTTVATIGYFSHINSISGRILIIILIVASLVEIPKKCSELMTLLASKSIFSRTTYKKLDKVNYILITGNISFSSMVDLLQEYFHPDHGESERHALILMPHKPDSNMKYLLQEYQNKLYYFEGDPLRENDLKRCQFKDASTIIILCNKQTDDSSAEDSKTILQAMAIKKYLMQEEENKKLKKINETKMLIQLLRPESELHFSLSVSKKSSVDQILCIDELKLSLLAKSCLCNGIIALISNLIMTSNLENINPKLLEQNKWLDEYKRGKSYEIYKVQLDFLRGYRFSEVVEMIFQEKGIIMFGVNIESKMDGTSLVILNPNEFYIPLTKDIIIYGYILAENNTDAENLVIWSDSKKKLNLKNSDKIPNLVNHQSINQYLQRRKSILYVGDGFDEIEEEQMSDKDNNELYSTDAITFSKICHITTEAIDKNSVTLDSIDTMLIAKGHIIICGICQNFIDFVKPLRAKYLPKSKCLTIVILSKELPDDKLWSSIAFFDQIYLVLGDPMNKNDLYRAGIRSAKKVVILAPSINEISRFNLTNKKSDSLDDMNKTARKLTREEEDLLDSKTIFKYNMISKIKKDIFIVVELINPKNVSFLYNKGREQNDEYRFIKANMNIDGTASFAAGEVYFSSIMDNLITQAYYNPSLLAVLKKLILGEDQSVYKKMPLSRYKDIQSANLYIIDLPDDRRTDIENTTTRMQENEIFVKKQTFKEIFLWYLKQKIIVIGVYRSIDQNNFVQNKNLSFNNFTKTHNTSNFYYVVTSPPPEFELNQKDKLFVFSQTFPDEEIASSDAKKGFNKEHEEIIKQMEHINFNKMVKKEEKKEIQKIFDQEGEKKTKEVNSNLKDIIDFLKVLKTSINSTREKIDRGIPDLIKKKIISIQEELKNIEEESSDN